LTNAHSRYSAESQEIKTKIKGVREGSHARVVELITEQVQAALVRWLNANNASQANP
jgi:hypothetical protein